MLDIEETKPPCGLGREDEYMILRMESRKLRRCPGCSRNVQRGEGAPELLDCESLKEGGPSQV